MKKVLTLVVTMLSVGTALLADFDIQHPDLKSMDYDGCSSGSTSHNDCIWRTVQNANADKNIYRDIDQSRFDSEIKGKSTSGRDPYSIGVLETAADLAEEETDHSDRQTRQLYGSIIAEYLGIPIEAEVAHAIAHARKSASRTADNEEITTQEIFLNSEIGVTTLMMEMNAMNQADTIRTEVNAKKRGLK